MNNIEYPIISTDDESRVEFVTTALSSVPLIGGTISASANHFIKKRQNKRLEDFFIKIAKDLNYIEYGMNMDFIKSEKFEEFIEDIFYKVSETIQKEKLDALRLIFLNTILSDEINHDETLEIVELINNWQPRHIILLKILSDPMLFDEQMGRVVGDGEGFSTSIPTILKKLLPEWDEDQIELTWKDLYKYNIHRTSEINIMLTDTGIHQLENRLTEYGKKIAYYLTNPIEEIY